MHEQTQYIALTHVLKYVLSTSDLGIEYDSGLMVNFKGVWKIVAHCNSNFAGDKNTWKLLDLVESLRTEERRHFLTEAEYVAVIEVCAEIIFIKQLLEFLGVNVEYPITVRCNNVGAIFLSYNAKNSNRKKHVDIPAHLVRQYVKDGIVKVIFFQSVDNEAYTFTKNLNSQIFQHYATKNLVSADRK